MSIFTNEDEFWTQALPAGIGVAIGIEVGMLYGFNLLTGDDTIPDIYIYTATILSTILYAVCGILHNKYKSLHTQIMFVLATIVITFVATTGRTYVYFQTSMSTKGMCYGSMKKIQPQSCLW
jgi:hypothetical protein